MYDMSPSQCLAFGGRKHPRLPFFMDSLENWYNSTFISSQSLSSASSRRSSAPSSLTIIDTTDNSHQVQLGGEKGSFPSLKACSGVSKHGFDRRRSSGPQKSRRKKLPAVIVMLEDVEGLNKQVCHCGPFIR